MSSSYFVANFLSIAIAISIVIYFYRRHQASRYHVDAVQAISLPQKDVGEMLSHAHSEEKRLNGHDHFAKSSIPREARYCFKRT